MGTSKPVRLLFFMVAAIGMAGLACQEAALAYWRSEHGGAAPGYLPAYWAQDAGVHLRASDQLKAQPGQLQAQAQAIGQAARDVLRRSPLDVLAMRQLGVLAEQRGAGSGQEYIALAERISRRDLTTEFLSIETAASQEDALASLRHIDHALSVYPLAKAQLLPIVASQLDDPEARQALLAYSGKAWLRDFVVNAVDYDVPPAALMDFYSDLKGQISVGDQQEGTIRLVRWLVSNSQYAALGSFVSRLPGIAPDAFADIGLNPATRDARFAPLSWTFNNDSVVDAQAEGDGVLISIEPGVTALAASRMTLLQPGEYEFSRRIERDGEAALAGLEWQVTCPENPGQQLLRPAITQAGAGAVLRDRLTIPAGCAAQFWQLKAIAAPSQFASSARISGMTLTGT